MKAASRRKRGGSSGGRAATSRASQKKLGKKSGSREEKIGRGPKGKGKKGSLGSQRARLVDNVLTKIPKGLKAELSGLTIKMENGVWSAADLRALGSRILATATKMSRGFRRSGKSGSQKKLSSRTKKK